MPDKQEIFEEFQSVFSGKQPILDSVLPPLLFALTNGLFGFNTAMWISFGFGGLLTIARLLRRQSLWYALGGLGAALLAMGLSVISGRAESYFLPGIINGGITVLVLLASVIIQRPTVAFTSHLTRRWPLGWYWHPQVRPAYSEVTLAWVIFFGLKLAVQAWFYTRGDADALALFNIISGWPATILLLAGSYIYGLKRLEALHGPSVEEFNMNTPPPWQGQRRGF
jgi:hypothetical protein